MPPPWAAGRWPQDGWGRTPLAATLRGEVEKIIRGNQRFTGLPLKSLETTYKCMLKTVMNPLVIFSPKKSKFSGRFFEP